MHATTRAVLVAIIRWAMLVVGVGVTTLSFERLVEVHNRIVDATPWWWLGLIGIALTVLGLGVPWSARARRDADSRRSGS